MRLFALLTARLCHELIGPAAAVENGLELIADGDPDFIAEALALVGDSARRTTARLQFYRFAYGFAGEEPAAGPSPGDLAARYFASEKIACRYREGVRALPLAWQKLGCNLLLVGAAALPRGGQLTLDAAAGDLWLEATGESIALSGEEAASLALGMPVNALTPRTVQAYFAGLLAQAQGARLIARAARAELRIRSEPSPA